MDSMNTMNYHNALIPILQSEPIKYVSMVVCFLLLFIFILEYIEHKIRKYKESKTEDKSLDLK